MSPDRDRDRGRDRDWDRGRGPGGPGGGGGGGFPPLTGGGGGGEPPQRPQSPDPEDGSVVLIGRIAPDVPDRALLDAFSRHGEILWWRFFGNGQAAFRFVRGAAAEEAVLDLDRVRSGEMDQGREGRRGVGCTLLFPRAFEFMRSERLRLVLGSKLLRGMEGASSLHERSSKRAPVA